MDPKAAAYYGKSTLASSLDRRPSSSLPGFHSISIALIAGCPTIGFAVSSGAFVFLYHWSVHIVFFLVSLCACISIFFMVLRPVRQGVAPFWLNVGLLCLLATSLGTTAGYWNYYRYVKEFWAVREHRAYQDVSANDLASLYRDAGKISFVTSTKLDLKNAFGSESSGGVPVCLAPIVPAGGPAPSKIQFWAAGVGCCSRSGYSCDDAASTQAHGGFVHRSEDVTDFREAVKSITSASGLSSADDPLFIRWLQNPDEAEWSFWSQAVWSWILSVVLVLAAFLAVALLLHCSSRAHDPK